MKKIPLESVRSIPQHAFKKMTSANIATVEELIKRTADAKDRILLERHTNLRHNEMFDILEEAKSLLPTTAVKKQPEPHMYTKDDILMPEDLPDWAA